MREEIEERESKRCDVTETRTDQRRCLGRLCFLPDTTFQPSDLASVKARLALMSATDACIQVLFITFLSQAIFRLETHHSTPIFQSLL